MQSRVFSQISGIPNEIKAGNLNAVLTRFSDLVLVGCIALMVGLMIVPLPTFLLDIFLTLNITIAITVLMVSLYVSNGAQIASYPTILLLTTLYRLSLEIASTRLILLKADAGEVIKAFGQFVVGGNFVVGAVIFLIITLVQFLVITKGAERVAEVAARFTLDAMPGKQMSIDADLRAGSIDFKVARSRRQALAKESQFYGAMDGAMKFVKGDAMAGIIITVINIVGGLIIGVAMNGMAASDAVQTYSILTIGDGLVAQIPALLISISAGMVVTRVASEDEETNLGSDIAGQILSQPKAIGVAAIIVFVMGLLPGMPKVAFLLLAGVTGAVSYGLFRAKRLKEDDRKKASAPVVAPPADPVVLNVVPLYIELGTELASYVSLEQPEGKQFLERIVSLRQSLYSQLGVVFPTLRLTGNLLPFSDGNNYRFWLTEIPIRFGRIRVDRLLVNATLKQLEEYGIEGEATFNPADNKPATWVDGANRDRVNAVGIKIWDTRDILVLHVAGFLRNYAKELLGVMEVQWLLNQFKRYNATIVDEVVPKIVTLQALTEILQSLVAEQVSIRDLRLILEAIARRPKTPGEQVDTAEITEHVRTALQKRICYQISEGKPRLVVYQLSPDIEDMIRDSIRQGPTGTFVGLASDQVEQVVGAVERTLGEIPNTSQIPVLLADSSIRRFVRQLLENTYPEIRVLSYSEIAPEISVEPAGVVSLSDLPTIESSTEASNDALASSQPG